jgi:hypothetical protein
MLKLPICEVPEVPKPCLPELPCKEEQKCEGKERPEKDHGWKGKDKVDKCEKDDKCDDKEHGWKGKGEHDKCEKKDDDCDDRGRPGKDDDKDHGWKGKDKDKCEKDDKCDDKEHGWKGKDNCEKDDKCEKEHTRKDKCDEEPVCKNPCDDGGDTCDLQAALASLSNSEIVDYGISQLSDGPTEMAALDVADTPLDSLGA